MATAVSRSKTLWFGVLGPPLLWFAQLNVNYQWEEVGACSPSATDRGFIGGLGVRPLIVLVNAVITVVVLAAVAGAVRCYRRTGPTEEGGVRTTVDHRDIAHWMALAGIVNSALFGLMIVAGFVPPLLLKTCQTPL